MTFLYVLLTVYILAINFYSFRLLKVQKEDTECGDKTALRTDGKLILAALIGGAPAVYASMFIFKYRLSNLLFMVAMPLICVLNLYCFVLGYRAIFLFL